MPLPLAAALLVGRYRSPGLRSRPHQAPQYDFRCPPPPEFDTRRRVDLPVPSLSNPSASRNSAAGPTGSSLRFTLASPREFNTRLGVGIAGALLVGRYRFPGSTDYPGGPTLRFALAPV